MSTYMPKAETVERKWYVIDAEGKPLGRVASLAASYLRGKNKPTFTPHIDCGDNIIIISRLSYIMRNRFTFSIFLSDIIIVIIAIII